MKYKIIYITFGIFLILSIIFVHKTQERLSAQLKHIFDLKIQTDSIEKRQIRLSEQLAYHKAFADKNTKFIIKDALMIEYGLDTDGSETKQKTIPLKDLIGLIVEKLELEIVEVKATKGGYGLKPGVDDKAATHEPQNGVSK